MTRIFFSVVIGAILGLSGGLYYGWVVAPIVLNDSPLSELDRRYQDEYILMIAAGYLDDDDVDAAVRRLSALGVENVPATVQEITERYITNSRSVADIRRLVALSAGLGRLTPPMESFYIPGEAS